MKNIIITGAAGSVGKHFISFLSKKTNTRIFAVDRDDYGLWNLQQEFPNVITILCDLTKPEQYREIENVYNKYIAENGVLNRQVDILHCAAYKNLDITEKSIFATVENDYISVEYFISFLLRTNWNYKFFLVSSDKAVNPISVLGASKLLAEKTVLRQNEHSTSDRYFVLRFPNILDTRGNVFEKWNKSKQNNRKYNVTDFNSTRYYIESYKMCKFIYSSIYELANTLPYAENIIIPHENKLQRSVIKDLILDYTFNLDGDVNVIGLRNGEKLIDELMTSEEREKAKTYSSSTFGADNVYVITNNSLVTAKG